MNPNEVAERDRIVAELRACGYVDIAEHNRLRPGVRVSHRGQQWPEAYLHGTGVVVALLEKPDSPWSRQYSMPDIEMLVLWDKPWPLSDSSRLSQLAQYHVCVTPR